MLKILRPLLVNTRRYSAKSYQETFRFMVDDGYTSDAFLKLEKITPDEHMKIKEEVHRLRHILEKKHAERVLTNLDIKNDILKLRATAAICYLGCTLPSMVGVPLFIMSGDAGSYFFATSLFLISGICNSTVYTEYRKQYTTLLDNAHKHKFFYWHKMIAINGKMKEYEDMYLKTEKNDSKDGPI